MIRNCPWLEEHFSFIATQLDEQLNIVTANQALRELVIQKGRPSKTQVTHGSAAEFHGSIPPQILEPVLGQELAFDDFRHLALI